jgi:DNA-binding transcriptional regulator YhcF (GntR family)
MLPLDGLGLQDNGIPIYVQLREQIAAAVGRGTLAPGARLPTMREVAVALRIDLNTVQRAYAELEREGILILVRGRGTFVAEAPRPQDHADKAQAFAASVAAQARAQGILLADLRAALDGFVDKTP